MKVELDNEINYFKIPCKGKEMGLYWQGIMQKSDYQKIIEYVDIMIKPLMEQSTEQEEEEYEKKRRLTAGYIIRDMEINISPRTQPDVVEKLNCLKDILSRQGFMWNMVD